MIHYAGVSCSPAMNVIDFLCQVSASCFETKVPPWKVEKDREDEGRFCSNQLLGLTVSTKAGVVGIFLGQLAACW